MRQLTLAATLWISVILMFTTMSTQVFGQSWIKPVANPSITQPCQSESQYFDTAIYQCRNCGENAKQNFTDGVSCKCPENMVKSEPRINGFSCDVCPDGQAPNRDQTACLTCATSGIFSSVISDRANLIEATLVVKDGEEGGQCVCPANYKNIVYDTLGKQIQVNSVDPLTPGLVDGISCQACPAGQYRGPPIRSIWECEACPNPNQEFNEGGNCVCKDTFQTAGDGCITIAQRDQLINDGYIVEDGLEYNVQYYNIQQIGREGQNELAVESDVFKHFYLQSAVGCKYNNDQKQCQILANLCVLQLYNERTVACRLFRSLQQDTTTPSTQGTFYQDEGWRQGLPWLYYSQSPKEVFDDPIDLTVSFSGDNESLSFVLARYSMDGEFQGLQRLTNDLSPCPMDMQEVEMSQRFGFVTENKCKFALFKLSKNDPNTLPLQANSFFELYIEDKNKQLVDVPVLIRGLRDIAGDQPNQSYRFGSETARLVHRFFMYDTISGIAKGYDQLKPPKYIRLATEVKITVQMDPDQEESIKKPLLDISYQVFETQLISENSDIDASYYVDMFEDDSSFKQSEEIVLIVFNCLVLIVVVVRMIYWVKMNPQQHYTHPQAAFNRSKQSPGAKFQKWAKAFSWKLLYYICDAWSNIMFMVAFVVTMIQFILYKGGSNASMLMPQRYDIENSAYERFAIYLWLIIITKTLAVLMAIGDQVTSEIFVIDWERYDKMKTIPIAQQESAEADKQPSQDQDANVSLNETDAQKKAREAKEREEKNRRNRGRREPSGEDVNSIAWRSLFIVNEFNELSTGMRRINPETTLIWFIFFYVALGWQWNAQTNPLMYRFDYPMQPVNELLRFFWSTFIYLSVVATQVVLRTIFVVPDSLNFADLCTLANCSLLVMTDRFQGYYIHGKAPWEKSDLPMAWLKMELDLEAANRRKGRTIGAESAKGALENQQQGNTYEIFMQPTFRANFDEWRNIPLGKMAITNKTAQEIADAKEKKKKEAEAKNKNEKNIVKTGPTEEELEDEHGFTDREDKIMREEKKKRIMNYKLCDTLERVNERQANTITTKGWLERLMLTAPSSFQFQDKPDNSNLPFHLVRDGNENHPAFERTLIFWLDFDINILMICYINLFAELTGNPMLSICLAYFIERILRGLRQILGEINISKKTYTPDCFLM